MQNQDTKTFVVRISADMLAVATIYARRLRVARNTLIRLAIAEYIADDSTPQNTIRKISQNQCREKYSSALRSEKEQVIKLLYDD